MGKGKRQQAVGVGFILLVLAVISFVYWGRQKQVWFCDEVYSYESANGFEEAWPDTRVDEWMTGADVEAFLSADSDELSLGAVTVRLYNDHVPLYFWIFRTVSLLFFPGSGSIWIGLVINLFFYLQIIALLYILFARLTDSPVLSAAVVIMICVVNRLMIEQITLLRMYVMLLWAELFLLATAFWVLRGAERGKLSLAAFVTLFLVSVAGLLTHYDFWVFYAVTAALFCLWLLISAIRRDRRSLLHSPEFRSVLAWIGNFAAALLVTVWVFPYCRWNLNRGKGQLALRSVFIFSPEKARQIAWGYEKLSATIFGGRLPAAVGLALLFACILGGMVILYRKREMGKLKGLILTVLTAQAYQIAVCFTFPGGEEERYLWGAFTVMQLCMAWGGVLLIRELKGVARCAAAVACFLCFLLVQILVIEGGDGVAYLFYPGKDTKVLREYGEIPWLVYGSAGAAYSYYDWIIPQRICFLTSDGTREDAAAVEELAADSFVLYVPEEDYSGALTFIGQQMGHELEGRYLMRSTSYCVYLVAVVH